MNLLETDFYVTKPVLAIHVPFGKGESVHNNRPSHGFAYYANGVYGYTFENKKTIVCKKGDLIYMPQNSNYTVNLQSHTEGAAKNIFAINFLISTDEKFEPFKITLKNPAKIEALFESAEREWEKKTSAMPTRFILIYIKFYHSLKRITVRNITAAGTEK